MDFSKSKEIKVAKGVGFLFSFILFTIILFLIFEVLTKSPLGWNYSSFFILGIGIVFVGTALKKVLG